VFLLWDSHLTYRDDPPSLGTSSDANCLTDRYADKQSVLYSNKGMLLSPKKEKKVLIYATTWMNFKDIILIEINQSPKSKFCMIPHICGRELKIRQTECEIVVSRDKGERNEKLLFDAYRISALEDVKSYRDRW
jgi:hypothetical protein